MINFKKKICLFSLFFNICFVFAQDFDLKLLTFSENLKEKANSIILNQSTEVEIISQSKYTEKVTKTVLVLNEYGVRNIDAVQYYSKNNRINSISATVYSFLGKKIKTYRKSDFIDQSIADGYSIAQDGRFLFLKVTPIEYPFVVVYESETTSSNTAFLPHWRPVDDPNESVARSNFSIKYPADIGFQFKTENHDGIDIIKKELPLQLIFEIKNFVAFQKEEYAPGFEKLTPKTFFSVEKFSLEGIYGQAKNWQEFGDWMVNNLLAGTDELPVATIDKIKQLVGNEDNAERKARIVYKFVQDKVRYVSIQLGIGGWKPMLAADVDRLGYGDCKALSNYTKALLNVVGVKAFYTIINGGSERQNIDSDMFRMQGNHAVLSFPSKNGLRILECTSQTSPFLFNANFTDDRDAFMVTKGDSKIVRTNKYLESESTQTITGNASIDENGKLFAKCNIVSKGVQYDNVDNIIRKQSDEIDAHYKSKFGYMNNLSFQKPILAIDKENVVGTENLNFTAENFAQNINGQLFFTVNIFNKFQETPKRYRNRKLPVEVAHGSEDSDEVELEIPDSFEIEAVPAVLEVNEKYGSYKMTCTKTKPNTISYKRFFRINTAKYPKEDYENFRNFLEKVAQNDASKIILKKK
jgi:hypothetical protein